MRWRLACLLLLVTSCTSGAHVTASTLAVPTPAPLAATPASAARSAPAETPDAGGVDFSAIQRLDPERGYVAGWHGTGLGLASTVDGGRTWSRITVPAAYLNKLRFIDANLGWVGGFSLPDTPQVGCNVRPPSGDPGCRGVVLRTENGGRSWADVLDVATGIGGSPPILDLQAVDGQRAWVLTGDPLCGRPPCLADIRRTVDGGRTWTTVQGGPVVAIRFASALHGWAVTAGATGDLSVLRTDDGGLTWRTAMYLPKASAVGLDAASASRVWLLTSNTETCTASTCVQFDLYRSDDGGLSWSDLGNPKETAAECPFGHLSGPLFASADRGWLGGNTGAGGVAGPTGLLQSDDGGRTWTCHAELRQIRLLSAADPGHVWVTGADPSLRRATLYATDDGGRSWRTLAIG